MLEIPNLSQRNPTTSPSVPNPKPMVTPVQETLHNKPKKSFLKYFLTFFISFLVVFTIISLIFFFTFYIPGKKLITQAQSLKTDVDKLSAAITNKDLKDTKTQIDNLKIKLSQLQTSFNKFSYLKTFPKVKDYYQDGQQFFEIGNNSLNAGLIVVEAIEPYQDFLGLKGTATSSAKTTEDRIAFLTQSIESLLPHMDTVETKIANIQQSLDKIDPNRYPEEYNGIQIKSNLSKAKEIVSQAHEFLKNSKPILSKTSWLLGKDKPRNYLIVFQNDGELRPSGGFWTAYATIKINKGKVIPGTASNIYDLDDKIQSTIPAPRLIKSYHINVPYLNLRDSNLSPDFPTDAEIFLNSYYKAVGKREIFDSVIALDTNVLVDLVRVLGKLDTRVGTFTTEPDKRCDGCPKIIYDLEWISGRPRNFIEKNRKDFLGPVMQALLANAMGSEKSKIPLLVEAFFNNLMQKNIMLYFPDKEMQNAAELANIAGKINATDQNTDYFHLNDANFSSAKSNIFIRQKIKHEITSQNGKVEHKISITYTNPSPASNCNLEKGDLCLNASKYRNLFRFYVAPNSQLIKITGSEIEPLVYDELGKKVFEGFYGNKYPLYAKASTKTSVQYTSSVSASANYSLLLQKQPGTKPIEYELWVNGKKTDAFNWVSDKIIKLAL